eukprot:scaffold119515_cov63-Phaeocystis_antarctica.AAC.1
MHVRSRQVTASTRSSSGASRCAAPPWAAARSWAARGCSCAMRGDEMACRAWARSEGGSSTSRRISPARSCGGASATSSRWSEADWSAPSTACSRPGMMAGAASEAATPGCEHSATNAEAAATPTAATGWCSEDRQ